MGRWSRFKYNELNEVVNSLGTAPNSNPRDVVTSKSDTVLNYDLIRVKSLINQETSIMSLIKECCNCSRKIF